MNEDALADPGVNARWHNKIFNGQWVDSQGGRLEVIEPATARVMATVGLGNTHHIAAQGAGFVCELLHKPHIRETIWKYSQPSRVGRVLPSVWRL